MGDVSFPFASNQAWSLIISLVFFTSCGMTNNHTDKKPSAMTDSTSFAIAPSTNLLQDKTVKFLWCIKKHNASKRDSFNTIVINEDYCKIITDPERAALGYEATFNGNECW